MCVCVCVRAILSVSISGQLQRMAPKRFGIQFLLIHLLFLPGLPLLHQLFHHKMPQIQNRQRRIWWHHWLVIYPCGSSWAKHVKTTNSQNLKQADSIEAYCQMSLSFKAVSELHQQISSNGSVTYNHTRLMGWWAACATARGYQQVVNTPFNNRVELPFCRSTGNSVPIGCHLAGRKEYVRTSVGREIICTHTPFPPRQWSNLIPTAGALPSGWPQQHIEARKVSFRPHRATQSFIDLNFGPCVPIKPISAYFKLGHLKINATFELRSFISMWTRELQADLPTPLSDSGRFGFTQSQQTSK